MRHLGTYIAALSAAAAPAIYEGDTLIRYGQLRSSVYGWGKHLLAAGLAQGDRVGLLARSADERDPQLPARAERNGEVRELGWLAVLEGDDAAAQFARKAEQLADNIGATKVALGADELKRLDAVSRLPSEYPGWMFTR